MTGVQTCALPILIAGRPNVGKSSLFNYLSGNDRAIVTEVPGTTRDLVTERVDLDGLPITLVDTAGWRDTTDVVEREGVARAARAREVADLVLVVLDGSTPPNDEDVELLDQTTERRRIIVANKSDLVTAGRPADVNVSALTGAGMNSLRTAIVGALTGSESLRDTAAMSNTRHIALVTSARANLLAAREAAGADEIGRAHV